LKNRLGWLLCLMLVASPVWAAKKITVEQLKDLLSGMQAAQKSDADVGAALQTVELTEQLTLPTMESLAKKYPGQNIAQQLFVLEISSALLAPPAADIPTAPAPDAAAQKAILDKAFDYSGKTFAQLPAVSVTKTIRRFQDNPPLTRGNTNGIPPHSFTPIQYASVDDYTVALRNGAEANPLLNEKKSWGANGIVAPLGQQPILNKVLEEAQGSGRISFVRWELIDGRQAAVFSFAVDKKKTHYAVNYCCFPEDEASGGADKDLNMRGGTGAAVGGFSPRVQAVQAQDVYPGFSSWKAFKATVPYHGEFAVDPNSGVVVRLTTVAEFKSSGWVRQENQRIDYAEEKVGDKSLVLPVRSIIDSAEQPFGDTESKDPSVRHTLYTAAYKDYKPAS
jgi:hypothetical protein